MTYANSKKNATVNVTFGKTTYEQGNTTVKLDCSGNFLDRVKSAIAGRTVRRYVEEIPATVERIAADGAQRIAEQLGDESIDINVDIKIGDIVMKCGDITIDITIKDNKSIDSGASQKVSDEGSSETTDGNMVKVDFSDEPLYVVRWTCKLTQTGGVGSAIPKSVAIDAADKSNIKRPDYYHWAEPYDQENPEHHNK